MFILSIFAFLAGLVTVISPCIIPILPALLSISGLKGKYRPHGVVIGLIASFTVFTLALSSIVQLTGIPAGIFRYAALIIILFFGLVLIVPKFGESFARVTAPIAQWGTRFQTRITGTGFFSGLLLGAALGLVWTPCAGPILATIISLAATSQISLSIILILLFYSVGAAIPMFFIIYGGQRALKSQRFFAAHAESIRKGFGALMIITALVIATNLDLAIQQLALKCFPIIPVEDLSLVIDRLSTLEKNRKLSNLSSPMLLQGDLESKPAPNFNGIDDWLNTPPLQLSDLKGKVVLVDFWTYSCINCLRTLPYLKQWYEKYQKDGLVVVGVHTPEFEFEKNKANVAKAAKKLGLNYPIALDNEYKTWSAYNNLYWPAHYLIDQQGIIRQIHHGEGSYVETENAIRKLLGLVALTKEKADHKIFRTITPETYLGYIRGNAYPLELDIKEDQDHLYNYSRALKDNQVSLQGKWEVKSDYIESRGENASLDLMFTASQVYLVLGGSSKFPVIVYLDGDPLASIYYTKDMNEKGEIYLDMPRKYDIVNLKENYGKHLLTLKIPQGIQAYAFTFGDGD